MESPTANRASGTLVWGTHPKSVLAERVPKCNGSTLLGYVIGSAVGYLPGFLISMPTALAIVQSDCGLALAADSFHCGLDGHVVSEKVQKIFPLSLPNSHLAYCLCGITTHSGIQDSGQSDLLFDYAIEVPRLLATLTELATLYQTVDALGRRIRRKLRKAISGVRTSNPGSTYIWFVGYYRGGWPELMVEEIRPTAVKGQIEHIVHRVEAKYNLIEGCFPGAVRQQFYSDALFAPFRTVGSSYAGIAMAVEVARQAVAACYDPGVRERYPECQVVGGKIHSAQVTRDKGFKWICLPDSYEQQGPI
jgi:hypothetical protein